MSVYQYIIISLCAISLNCAKNNSVDTTDMVLIPAGEFTMGSTREEAKYIFELNPRISSEDWFYDEQPSHQVYLDSFYLDKYEVTNKEFKKFVNETGYIPKGKWEKICSAYENSDHLPAVGLTWLDANSYAKWSGKRLPTEAEWEKAVRGGKDGFIYPWGNKVDTTKANLQNSNGPKPVGSYPSNGFGIYDMVGNAQEWCSDWYSADYYQKSPYQNPRGPKNGDYHVVRGGSWYLNYLFYARCAFRTYVDTAYTSIIDVVGLRCAYSPK